MKLLRLALLATLLLSFNNAWSATLTESPATVAQGSAATVTSSAVAAPTNTDWIGLYAPAAGDSGYLDWLYVNSCGKSAGASASASGSCSFVIPSSLANGTYEFRLYAANGYSRLATSASFNVGPVAPPSTRFVDNGDGTISDTQTGLMWEKKDAGVGEPTDPIACGTFSPCLSSHSAYNIYSWTSSGTAPDGLLFTNFLKRNTAEFSTSTTGSIIPDVCYLGYCDWRIPNIAELRTILLANCPGGASPCIDPIFGVTATNFHLYWSSTTDQSVPSAAWAVNFSDGTVQSLDKAKFHYARAVRGYR